MGATNPAAVHRIDKAKRLKNIDSIFKRDRTPLGRHSHVRRVLREDITPKTDPLWSLNFYTELIRDGECHYCLGQLSPTSHALDRVNNEIGHFCFNVVPCCQNCNRIKGEYWEYEHMMLLAPKLRKIQEEKQNAGKSNECDCSGLGKITSKSAEPENINVAV